jgi:signal transduction histidine kinase
MPVEILSMAGTIFLAVAYMVAAGVLWRKRSLVEPINRYLVAYAIFAFLGGLLLAVVGYFGQSYLATGLYDSISLYGGYLLAFLVMVYSPIFLQTKINNRLWIIIGISWLIVWIPSAMFVVKNPYVSLATVVIGWLFMMGRTVQLTIKMYQLAKQPLHKNRLVYWVLALGFLAAGNIFQFAKQNLVGGALCLVGFVIVSYVILIHNPVDLFRTGLQSLRILIISTITVLIYVVGFTLFQSLMTRLQTRSVIIDGIILAALFVLVFNPMIGLVASRVNRLVFGLGYDPSSVVREYSQSVSNIVDLRLLKQVSLKLIQKAVGVQYGNLFLVDEPKGNGESHLLLSPVLSVEEDDKEVKQGRLSAQNSIAMHFIETQQPLTQYDVDFSPRFKNIPTDEHDWLASQGMDVYIPIYSKAGWIGLFALGPKDSGERYFEEDLLLLSTLADQTAVALENARLFAHLIKLNKELQQAQVNLQQANQQLHQMDELKSSFIGVITHELRTPLANIGFSMQIFEMYGYKNISAEQREQVEQIGVNLSTARMMVDNLITFAAFLNKQMELHLETVDFKLTVLETLVPIKHMADGKDVRLQVDFLGDIVPVKGDRKLLQDAVHHLVHNAVKYTQEGGHVWVSSWMTSDAVYFDVKDTGVGVPPEKLKVLWDGFTQATDPVRRGVEGLGLGLSLVRFIIAAHGGKVWIDSQLGKGSTFGFWIPTAGPGLPTKLSDSVLRGQDIIHPE